MRLVPAQDPREIGEALKTRVAELVPPGVGVSVRELGVDPPISVGVDGRAVQAAARAFMRAFGRQPVFVRTGGGNPLLPALQQYLLGAFYFPAFGAPDDHLHSSQEHPARAHFERGTHTNT